MAMIAVIERTRMKNRLMVGNPREVFFYRGKDNDLLYQSGTLTPKDSSKFETQVASFSFGKSRRDR